MTMSYIQKFNSEFFRFCCVGVLCTLLDWGIFSLCCFILPYQISLVIGFIISFVANYWLSALWTFKQAPTKRRFVGMIGVHLINLFVVRMGILTALIDIVNIEERIAYIPTLLISAITSFLMVRYVFKKKKDTTQF